MSARAMVATDTQPWQGHGFDGDSISPHSTHGSGGHHMQPMGVPPEFSGIGVPDGPQRKHRVSPLSGSNACTGTYPPYSASHRIAWRSDMVHRKDNCQRERGHADQ
jgi:hypothetical protein